MFLVSSYTVHPELDAFFMVASYFAYSSTLKMESICSSETSVDFHRTTRRYVAEDGRTAHRLMALENSVLRTILDLEGGSKRRLEKIP
jgi:hypothetical protein